MNKLKSQLEALLFISGKPVSLKKLARLSAAEESAVLAALNELQGEYDARESGVALFSAGDEWQMMTRPEHQSLAEKLTESELTGELTKPQLETLTVIAYAGPITKPELEQIRGVNCSLIVRNLLVRGLIKEVGETDAVIPAYEVTMDFIRHIGLTNVSELPDYAALHAHPTLAAERAGESLS